MRRRLGMSWAEWRRLPWYEQRALREGLVGEFSDQPPDDTDLTEEDEHARLQAMGLSVN